MNISDELLKIADNLETQAQLGFDKKITEPIKKMTEAVNIIDKSFSGSWLGYHANVYYKDFDQPPPNCHFDQQCGLQNKILNGTSPSWQEYTDDAVITAIENIAGNSELEPARELAQKLQQAFEDNKSEVLSILNAELSDSADEFLESIKEQVGKLEFYNQHKILKSLNPKKQVITSDYLAMNQGAKPPPHMQVKAELMYLHNSTALVSELSKIARKIGSHLSRKNKNAQRSEMIGTNVFIGHGNSLVWRELKDFIKEKLHLPYDEFNRVPVAGITNIARLSEMLDAATIAFIILTGEDEQADEKLHARMNAIHEAGLFQGKLGFTRAIILLEEGCEEFSNIEGLGQIRFPKGSISAAFEDIRDVLERENII